MGLLKFVYIIKVPACTKIWIQDISQSHWQPNLDDLGLIVSIFLQYN